MENITNYNNFINESKLQEEYRDFFYNLLKLYDIKSPSNLKDKPEISKKFYNDLDKGWLKGKGLTDYGRNLFNINDDKEYKKYFDSLLKVYKIKSLKELEDKPEISKEFYSDLDKGWLKGEGLTDYGKKLLKISKLSKMNESIITIDNLEKNSDEEKKYNEFVDKYNSLVKEYELGLGIYKDGLVVLNTNNDNILLLDTDDLNIKIK